MIVRETANGGYWNVQGIVRDSKYAAERGDDRMSSHIWYMQIAIANLRSSAGTPGLYMAAAGVSGCARWSLLESALG